ncbi:MAG: membrane protein insertase YidC [Candidatus Eisenbacteria bacterium]|nr:membrane protein insertase YidC [Candidatus Eisenbacteria bacterium]
MEKRLVLFFVLVALTMILFQQFVQPVRRAPPGEPVEADSASTSGWAAMPPESRGAELPDSVAVGGDGYLEGFLTAPAETVTVQTDDLSVRVASVGAKLVSCELPRFIESDGRPVRLFPQEYPGALGMTVNRGGDHPLDDLPFQMQVAQTPSDGIAARIEWSASRQDGAWIRKTLEIPQTGYACRLRLESRGLGLAGFRLEFPPGLRSTERNQKDDHTYFAAMAGVSGRTWKQELGKLKEGVASSEGPTSWLGLRSKYFIAALVPDSLTWHRISTMGGAALGSIGIGAEGMALGGSLDAAYTLYLGPLDYDRLAPIGGGVVHAVEMGNRYLRPIGRVVLLFLTSVHKGVPNYGIVIILFAVAMKLLLQPLTMTTTRSMQRMQELQPKLTAIKEKYKNNPQKQQQETMKLYKEQGINPLGGCLPMLLQMPIFFAMYPVLRASIHLRGASFIPGIVGDLSQPNPILPVLMGLTQFISGKMMATDKQNKALAYVMPVFMTYIFFQMPSGLVLYWLMFNVLQIGEQMWRKRRAAEKPAS